MDASLLADLLRACLEHLQPNGVDPAKANDNAPGLLERQREDIILAERVRSALAKENAPPMTPVVVNQAPANGKTAVQTHSLPTIKPARSSFYSDHNVFSSQLQVEEDAVVPSLFLPPPSTPSPAIVTMWQA
jgi:hypothetical protein